MVLAPVLMGDLKEQARPVLGQLRVSLPTDPSHEDHFVAPAWIGVPDQAADHAPGVEGTILGLSLDFEAEKDNAFWMARDGDVTTLEARWDGETHRLSINGTVEYTSPSFTATLEAETLAVLSAKATANAVDGQTLSLERAAQMYAFWRGLDQSMPQVPFAGREGSKVAHPGYPED